MKIREELKTTLKWLKMAAVPGCLLFATFHAQAATVVWTFDTGVAACPLSSTENCNGEATISYTTGSNSFTVTLTNLLTPIKDAGQLLTDFDFTASLGTLSLTGSNGTQIFLDSSGNATTGTTGTTGWALQNPSSSNFVLCVICPSGIGTAPKQGILPNEGSTYTGINSSLGTSHQPFLASGATFTIGTSVALPTSTTVDPFSNVAISFGTDFGAGLPAGGGGPQGGPTPEPFTAMLGGAGLIAIGLMRRRKKV